MYEKQNNIYYMKDTDISIIILKFIDGDTTTDKEYKELNKFIKLVIKATRKKRALDEMEIEDITSICLHRLLLIKDKFNREESLASAYYSTCIRNEVIQYFQRMKPNISLDTIMVESGTGESYINFLEGDINKLDLDQEDYDLQEEVRSYVEYEYPILFDFIYGSPYSPPITDKQKRYCTDSDLENTRLYTIAEKHGYEYTTKFMNMISRQRKELNLYFKRKYNLKDIPIKEIIYTEKELLKREKQKEYKKQWELKRKTHHQ